MTFSGKLTLFQRVLSYLQNLFTELTRTYLNKKQCQLTTKYFLDVLAFLNDPSDDVLEIINKNCGSTPFFRRNLYREPENYRMTQRTSTILILQILTKAYSTECVRGLP